MDVVALLMLGDRDVFVNLNGIDSCLFNDELNELSGKDIR